MEKTIEKGKVILVMTPEEYCESTFKQARVVKPEEEGDSMEIRITRFLSELGVPQHVKGYKYLRKAIELSVEDPSRIILGAQLICLKGR